MLITYKTQILRPRNIIPIQLAMKNNMGSLNCGVKTFFVMCCQNIFHGSGLVWI